jgi:hypothetical protein
VVETAGIEPASDGALVGIYERSLYIWISELNRPETGCCRSQPLCFVPEGKATSKLAIYFIRSRTANGRAVRSLGWGLSSHCKAGEADVFAS